MRQRERLVGLAKTLCFLGGVGLLISLPQAHAQVPQPGLSFEWAVAKTPSIEYAATYGYGAGLGKVDIKDVPSQIYVQKNLAQQVQATQLPLKTIQITAPPAWKTSGLRAELAKFEGKPLSVEELAALSAQIKAWCQQNTMPANITLDWVNENTLSVQFQPLTFRNVQITDGKWIKARAIRGRLGIDPGDPLDVKRLKAKIKHIQENPDMGFETELAPVEFTNDVDVKIKLGDQLPLHFGGYWANYDQRVFGLSIMGFAAIHNNLLGFGDSLMLAPLVDPRLYGGFARYEIPVGSYGTRLGVEGSWIHGRPLGPAFAGQGVDGDGYAVTPFIVQDLWRGENSRLAADLNFDIQEFDVDSNFGDLEREAFRVLRFGMQYDANTKIGAISTRHEGAWGIDFLGATKPGDPLSSRAGGRFFRYLGTLVDTIALPYSASAVITGVYQYSPDVLNNLLSIGAGGTLFGRGYREYVYVLDTVTYWSVQLQTPTYFIPKSWKLPGRETRLRDDIQLVSFVDYAWGRSNMPGLVDAAEHILGVGGGVRVKLTPYLDGRLDVGFPLLNQLNANSPRLYFGIKSNIR